jgi:leucyl/phenylalanyl-tRNA--protein transferase
MKKMIMINGDPNGSSSLTDAVNEMIRVLNENEVATEYYQIGHLPIRGCMDCGKCLEGGKCVFEDDPVNEVAEKLETADGLIVCSPTCYNSPAGTVISFMDRLFRSVNCSLTTKIGACFVLSRDNGELTMGIDILNQYFGAAGMKIASVSFWEPETCECDDPERMNLERAGNLARRVVQMGEELTAAAENGELSRIKGDYATRFYDGDFKQLRKRPVPLFILDEHKPEFPNPQYGSGTGFFAVGGDVTPDWLAEAYSKGIIPWSDYGAPLMWYCPQDRFVILPSDLHVSYSITRFMRKHKVTLSINRDFADTMHRCRAKWEFTEEGTWITDEVEEAYIAMWEAGYAYSTEVFVDGELAGGQYGIRIGRCLIGESMFSLQPDGSKMGLALLLRYAEEHGFLMFDCQVPSEFLVRMGAKTISYGEYMRLMKQGLQNPPELGEWKVENYQKEW